MANGSFRLLYEDDVLALRRDTTSSFTAAGLTATNFVFVGAPNWTIMLTPSLSSAGISGNITVQGNNTNLIDRSISGLYWSVNPLLKQGSGQQGGFHQNYNPSFKSNWNDIATLSAGYTVLSISNIPVRYIRLQGLALTAANFAAYVWTDGMSQGN